MKKFHKKLFYTKLLFFVFLLTGFLFVSGNRILAAELEVKYPALQNGTTIDSNTQLPAYVKYLFDFGMVIGFWAVFISLAIAGVMYLMSPAKPDWLSGARDRVGGAISWNGTFRKVAT